MDALDAIMTRRSIRQFTDEPVSDAEIDTVVRAAMAAPSAHNGRPWRFVVVREREQLERLSTATPFAGPLATAQAGIVVCTEKTIGPYAGFWVIDCSAAIQNALVAAHAIGLGGLWIGVHPIAPFRLAVRRVVGAPRNITVHSMIAIGRPAKEKEAVDRFEADWVHRDRW
ncbi:MAG: nitroreductase family protein [Coriobacteriia bacterium]|nr:nitroreductase family protein [Coriobacteriia bacterium]